MTNVPTVGELNKFIIQIVNNFGETGYLWDDSYDGVSEDLVYDGQILARKSAEKVTYCCGLTFEIFFKSWMLWTQQFLHLSTRSHFVANLSLMN